MPALTLPSRKSVPGRQCDCVHHLDTGPIPMTTCVRCLGTGRTDPRRERTIKKNRERRIPTQEQIDAFNGAHCRLLYASLGPHWRCPGCRRTKYQAIRWTTLFRNSPNSYQGWACGLAKHHDHGPRPARFPETVMCEQCNSADGTAKRVLRLPDDFSFSPAEVNRFVLPTPHGWHLIDYLAAQNLYAAVRRPLPPPPPLIFWPPGTSS
ncbi:hypothetical protein GCM10009094_41100 [Massilia aurea]